MSHEEELPKDVLSILNGRRLEDLAIKVTYKNWRGKEGIRRILPIRIFYGSTEWHPEEQWLIEVYDLDKKAKRDYALRDLRGSRES